MKAIRSLVFALLPVLAITFQQTMPRAFFWRASSSQAYSSVTQKGDHKAGVVDDEVLHIQLPTQSLATNTTWLSLSKPSTVSMQHSLDSHVAALVKRESQLTYGLLQSDIPVTVVLGTLSTIAFGLARTTPPSTVEWIDLFASLLFGSSDMDIASSLATKSVVSTKTESTSEKSPHPALTLCAALWVITSQALNFHGGSNHFATKNYIGMSLGSISMLLGARHIAGETTASVIPSILAACWIGLCMDSQDLRDEEGDRLVGRRTLAVVLGVDTARRAYFAIASAATVGLLAILHRCLGWLDGFVTLGLVAHLVRTFGNRTTKEDGQTYNEICVIGALFFFRSAFWAQSF